MKPLDPRIHQVLDGELPRDALPPEALRDLERLERAIGRLAAPVEESVASRVMAEVRRPPPAPRPWLARVAAWATRPSFVTFRLRPAYALPALVVVTAAAVALLAPQLTVPRLAPNEGIAQFVLAAPGARSVHVAGSFNDWRPTALAMQDHDRDGVWRADVVLPVGEHEYMFVVDGERWVTDPSAGRYVDDGFNRQNGLLIVRPVSGP